MSRCRGWALAIAVVAAIVLVPAGLASAQVVKTRISLLEFKRAYNLAAVSRRLVDPLPDGVTFKLVKRDKNGKPIDFSDPNRTWTSAKRSFIVFRADASRLPSVFASLMQANVQFQLAGGERSIYSQITCGLGGTSGSGVSSLQCADGPVVSPN
jgi:hypothetical protein